MSFELSTEEVIIGRTESDIKKYGKKGTGFLGKVVMSSGENPVLGRKIIVDLARPHVVLICGKRGGGKSYTMSVFLEGFNQLPPDIRNKMAIIVIDTVGIFWSMKLPNREESDSLYDWGLEPQGLNNFRVLVPAGKLEFYEKNKLPVDSAFSLKLADIDATEWLSMFHLSWSNIESAILLEAIEKARSTFNTYYGLPEIYSIIDSLETYDLKDRASLKNRFKVADSWGIFFKDGSNITDIAKPGAITVVDVSTYGQVLGMENVREIIVAILGKRLFEQRELERKREEIMLIAGEDKQADLPMVWMLIDEAHMFMPKDRSSMALDVLLEWVRVGRQPGLSLLLATQRPERLHPDAISQCDLFISMRLTAKMDIDSVGALRPSYLNEDMDKYYATLPRAKGYALILDDNSEKLWMVKIRPRTTWDAGKTASAFKR
jgi:DNA helicase HerA-like ATPase